MNSLGGWASAWVTVKRGLGFLHAMLSKYHQEDRENQPEQVVFLKQEDNTKIMLGTKIGPRVLLASNRARSAHEHITVPRPRPP